MNVLSLFDGMSCGQVALERAGIGYDRYFASEVDKYAIQIAKKNYPKTEHLGNAQFVSGDNLPKIDLLIGGSPCQGFSFAGKQLNFNDPRSKLFFEFVRILEECRKKNPDIKFLMENVKMKKQSQDVITGMLGVEPIEINSALVSAQNRKRLYWTNIEGVEQPEDRGIFLKNVLFSDALPFYCDTVRVWQEKTCRINTEKSTTLRTPSGGGRVQSLILSEKAIEYMNRDLEKHNHWKHSHDINDPKSKCIVANFFKGVPYNVLKDFDCLRKFHPIECERLQTLPDNYTEGVSNTQRYKMIGNGWTIDVIAHILKNLKKGDEYEQLRLEKNV